MLTLLSLYTCHTVRPLKLSTQVLVLELTLLTSMPALLSVYRLQCAQFTLRTGMLCYVQHNVQCTERNVQQPVYLHCTLCSNWCIITIQCAATSVCAVCCNLCTVHCTVCSNLALPCGGFGHYLLDRVSHTLVLWSPLHALSVLAFDSLQCWCWTLFECCHKLFHWYLVLSSTRDHRMWYRPPLCPKAGNADQARCAFEWTGGWVQQRPGRDTRSPDKVARNYAVILWQPGPGPTHPLTFWARSSFPIHSKMCGFQMSPSLKLLQSEIHCRPV